MVEEWLKNYSKSMARIKSLELRKNMYSEKNIEKELNFEKAKIDFLNNLINILHSQDREFIKKVYIENKSWREISDELYYTRSGFYKVKERCLTELENYCKKYLNGNTGMEQVAVWEI